MPRKPAIDRIKLLYEENATQFRFFLTWRQLMLAGYFATMAALALGFKWCISEAHAYVWACPFVGAWLSAIFWALDHRNLELYQLANRVGSALEKTLGDNLAGHFTAYQARRAPRILRHQVILGTFYIVSGLALLIVGILSFVTDLTVVIHAAPK